MCVWVRALIELQSFELNRSCTRYAISISIHLKGEGEIFFANFKIIFFVFCESLQKRKTDCLSKNLWKKEEKNFEPELVRTLRKSNLQF